MFNRGAGHMDEFVFLHLYTIISRRPQKSDGHVLPEQDGRKIKNLIVMRSENV